MSSEENRWLPLESNPDVMTIFMQKLGMSSDWSFCDVYGLDSELLAMVPQPTAAVLLLFPINDIYEEFCREETARIEKIGQTLSPNIWFMRQSIGNACGTIALLHALGNTAPQQISVNGILASFLEDSKSKDPNEKGLLLQEHKLLTIAHEESATEGQTNAPTIEACTDLHFIAFVHKDGHLYELDGRKSFPICHGTTTADTLLKDTAVVIRQFMSRSPNELNFNVIALSKTN